MISSSPRSRAASSPAPERTPEPARRGSFRDLAGRPVLPVRFGPVSAQPSRRTVLIGLGIAVLLLILGAWAMTQGDRNLSAGQVWDALMARGERLDIYFVNQVRLPRVLAALLVGACLGLSGAIFQIISGNALGSPDIIGFTHGAATGALIQIILFDAGPLGTAVGAVVGGFATAAAVYLLARHGGLQGDRLVLIGLGLGAALAALNTLLVVRASLGQAQTAASWLAGSLNTMNWSKLLLVIIALAVLGPVLLRASRPLGLMRLPDAVGIGLGEPIGRWRNLLLFIGVLLVSVATAITGPLAFVALAAPHIARSLTRTTGAGLVPSALMGALIVLGSDLIGQYVFPATLQVGVVTGALGGSYLIYLIFRERHQP